MSFTPDEILTHYCAVYHTGTDRFTICTEIDITLILNRTVIMATFSDD